jgi:hypothetical protein
MQLTLAHKTTKEEAIEKIDNYAQEMMEKKHNWVNISEQKKEWDGNIVRFSFTAKKMFVSMEIKGNAIITDTEVVLNADLPGMVEKIVSEYEIKESIKKEFDKIFDIS